MATVTFPAPTLMVQLQYLGMKITVASSCGDLGVPRIYRVLDSSCVTCFYV